MENETLKSLFDFLGVAGWIASALTLIYLLKCTQKFHAVLRNWCEANSIAILAGKKITDENREKISDLRDLLNHSGQAYGQIHQGFEDRIRALEEKG